MAGITAIKLAAGGPEIKPLAGNRLRSGAVIMRDSHEGSRHKVNFRSFLESWSTVGTFSWRFDAEWHRGCGRKRHPSEGDAVYGDCLESGVGASSAHRPAKSASIMRSAPTATWGTYSLRARNQNASFRMTNCTGRRTHSHRTKFILNCFGDQRSIAGRFRQ
jgi:hypothetical protein